MVSLKCCKEKQEQTSILYPVKHHSKLKAKKKKRHFQMKTELSSAANQTKNSTKVSSLGWREMTSDGHSDQGKETKASKMVKMWV